MNFNQIPNDILDLIYEMKTKAELLDNIEKYARSNYKFVMKDLSSKQNDAIKDYEIWRDNTVIENMIRFLEPEDDDSHSQFCHSIKYDDVLWSILYRGPPDILSSKLTTDGYMDDYDELYREFIIN